MWLGAKAFVRDLAGHLQKDLYFLGFCSFPHVKFEFFAFSRPWREKAYRENYSSFELGRDA